eukprot:10512599-Lingulodinium_polyedra.AAC.1
MASFDLVVPAIRRVLLSCPMLERRQFAIAACLVRLYPPWRGAAWSVRAPRPSGSGGPGGMRPL